MKNEMKELSPRDEREKLNFVLNRYGKSLHSVGSESESAMNYDLMKTRLNKEA